MPNYRVVAMATTALYLSLFAVLLVAPTVLFAIFGITPHTSTIVISRRAALLFLGLSTIAWLSRGAAPSPARRAISAGMVVALSSLAVLGTGEYLAGNVGPGVFLAVTGELAFATAFVLAERTPAPASDE